jgi:pimeloyl-ACP methyl ester carboxylesterase
MGPAGTIHVDDGGAGGIPVVFVHSFGGSSAHWSVQLAHLRPSRRAVALDLRGHGRSAAPPGNDYAVESLAQDIAAVVDSLGIPRFVLVGHSMGAAAAAAYAGAHPDRVAGLVLVGAPGRTPEAQVAQIMASLDKDYDNVMRAYSDKLLAEARPEVKTRLSGEMASISREESLSIIKALFQFDPVPAIQRYPGPKLIISTDTETSPTDLQNLMPQIPHQTITGTSHWPHLDKPDEFNRMLDDFLATIH